MYNRKKLHFEEKNAKIRIILKNSKISLKENGVVFFDSKHNVNIFSRVFSNVADSLMRKHPLPKNKFGIKTTEEYYKQIRNEREDFVYTI